MAHRLFLLALALSCAACGGKTELSDFELSEEIPLGCDISAAPRLLIESPAWPPSFGTLVAVDEGERYLLAASIGGSGTAEGHLFILDGASLTEQSRLIIGGEQVVAAELDGDVVAIDVSRTSMGLGAPTTRHELARVGATLVHLTDERVCLGCRPVQQPPVLLHDYEVTAFFPRDVFVCARDGLDKTVITFMEGAVHGVLRGVDPTVALINQGEGLAAISFDHDGIVGTQDLPLGPHHQPYGNTSGEGPTFVGARTEAPSSTTLVVFRFDSTGAHEQTFTHEGVLPDSSAGSLLSMSESNGTLAIAFSTDAPPAAHVLVIDPDDGRVLLAPTTIRLDHLHSRGPVSVLVAPHRRGHALLIAGSAPETGRGIYGLSFPCRAE